MQTSKIKTIDVQAKEWFDKTFGNSYFSANVTINFGRKDQQSFYIPFNYGYGSHYVDVAFNEIKKRLNCFKKYDKNTALWHACENEKIVLRTSKKENCLKRDL